jgi:hypothetical protein
MQPITLIGMLVAFGVLFLKYKAQAARGPVPRSPTRRTFKTAKLLISALLTLLAIGFALRRQEASIDGQAPEPSFMEKLVDVVKDKL